MCPQEQGPRISRGPKSPITSHPAYHMRHIQIHIRDIFLLQERVCAQTVGTNEQPIQSSIEYPVYSTQHSASVPTSAIADSA